MKRDELIEQVKEHYADIAFNKKQQHFYQTTSDITAKQYYAQLEQAVISEIKKGKFDNARSGQEIVGAVAADKTLLTQWK